MDAVGRSALIDAVETVVRADARADVVLTLLDDLSHDMRVGHVGARHADHVDLARGDGVARCCDVRDLRRMEDWKIGRCADFARKIEMRRVCHALDRDDIGQTRDPYRYGRG